MAAKLSKISSYNFLYSIMFDVQNLEVIISDIYDDIWLKKNISLSLLRLDLIHPVISGNKFFKLYYFLKKAIELNLKIITFGGAYSNHLAAAAAACNLYNLQSVGIVRGEESPALSPTLLYCLQQNMHLEFISRTNYRQKDEDKFQKSLQSRYGDHILIPEGGFSAEGVNGAAEIYRFISNSYTHICCSAGTVTTLAGLIQAASHSQQVIGFSALKNPDFKERLTCLLNNTLPENYGFIDKYHFGGYAKKTNELIDFMNIFYQDHSIPLDFVYTGKMMYGVTDMIKQNYFAKNSRIICVHTGGLQGNTSLKPGALKY